LLEWLAKRDSNLFNEHFNVFLLYTARPTNILCAIAMLFLPNEWTRLILAGGAREE